MQEFLYFAVLHSLGLGRLRQLRTDRRSPPLGALDVSTAADRDADRALRRRNLHGESPPPTGWDGGGGPTAPFASTVCRGATRISSSRRSSTIWPRGCSSASTAPAAVDAIAAIQRRHEDAAAGRIGSARVVGVAAACSERVEALRDELAADEKVRAERMHTSRPRAPLHRRPRHPAPLARGVPAGRCRHPALSLRRQRQAGSLPSTRDSRSTSPMPKTRRSTRSRRDATSGSTSRPRDATSRSKGLRGRSSRFRNARRSGSSRRPRGATRSSGSGRARRRTSRRLARASATRRRRSPSPIAMTTTRSSPTTATATRHDAGA